MPQPTSVPNRWLKNRSMRLGRRNIGRVSLILSSLYRMIGPIVPNVHRFKAGHCYYSSRTMNADTPFLYLTTTGRKTGLPREIEIWFVEADGRLYILAE